jgi:hypothetical protein
MLIANNGAVKSGTTWVQSILRALRPYDALPEQWQKTEWKNPCVDPDKLDAFINSDDFASGVYLIKSHYSPVLAPQLAKPGVVIINCARSIPDMVLSAYHHTRRRQQVAVPINEWMAQNALKTAKSRMRYLKGWAPHGPTMHFELMFADPEGAALQLAELCGSTLKEKQVRAVGLRSKKTPTTKQEGSAVRTGRPGAGCEEIDPEIYAALAAFDDELLELFPERAAITSAS